MSLIMSKMAYILINMFKLSEHSGFKIPIKHRCNVQTKT